MSYTAEDQAPAPSSLDGQPLDDDGVCVAYSSTSKNIRDKYYAKRYNRRSRSTDKQCAGAMSRTDSRSPSRSCDYYTKRRRRERSRHRRSRSRSRSTSRRRHYERKHRRRDDRKSRHTKSRSRSRHSRSRSRRSRSRSRDYYSHCRRSRSRCCRYNGSCSCSSSSSTYSDRDTSSLYRSHGRKYVREVPKDQDYIRKVYAKHDEVPVQENSFKNDGSFLEMFKKMQEEKAAEEKKEEPVPASISEVKKSIPIFGKRRGGRILKTGLVQKIKSPTEVEEEPKDAWSVYMKEVKRYKEACCDDDSKTRPLVK